MCFFGSFCSDGAATGQCEPILRIGKNKNRAGFLTLGPWNRFKSTSTYQTDCAVPCSECKYIKHRLMICFCTTQTCSFPEAPTGSWSCNNSKPTNDFNWGKKRFDWRIGRILTLLWRGRVEMLELFWLLGIWNHYELWSSLKSEVDQNPDEMDRQWCTAWAPPAWLKTICLQSFSSSLISCNL